MILPAAQLRKHRAPNGADKRAAKKLRPHLEFIKA